MVEQTPAIGPEQIQQLYSGMMPSRVIQAAARFDVFGQLEAGRDSAAAVAQAAGASERGMRMLLDALVALGLAEKAGGRYRAAAPARRYLTRGSPDYIGAVIEQDELWQAWSALPEAIQSGKPKRSVDDQAKAERFFPALVQTLHVLNQEPARRAAAALAQGKPGARVIDIACGSGLWGIALAEADREARITAQDFPGVLELTRAYAERHGVAGRFDYLPGDLTSVALPKAAYDVAILGNILHALGETVSRALLERLHAALKPGGRVAIIEMIPNEARTGPPFPLIFALNMLVHTDEGDTYTLAELGAWLAAAGFGPAETVEIGSHSPMVVAARR